jgi:hypothetical protein
MGENPTIWIPPFGLSDPCSPRLPPLRSPASITYHGLTLTPAGLWTSDYLPGLVASFVPPLFLMAAVAL